MLDLIETCKALRVVSLGGVQRTGWEEPAKLHPRIREFTYSLVISRFASRYYMRAG